MASTDGLDPDLTPILYVADPASVAVIQCSPPSWMARIVLEEKRVPHEIVSLAFDRDEHRTPHMLALNPRGTVPVLEHAGAVVHETYAILDYLDFAFPERPLLPRAPEARAAALTRYHEASALKAVGMGLFAAMMRGAQGEELEPARDRFAEELAIWAGYVGTSEGLAGEFSLADVVVLPYVATAARLGLPLPDALEGWLARLRERPSVRETWPRTWSAAREP
jgi:glutathione S-transferase